MTKHTVWIAAAVALLSRGGSPDITGDWSVVAKVAPAHDPKGGDQRIELVCAFEQHEERLTGSCRPSNGPEGIAVVGTAHDRQVTWSFDIAPTEKAQKERVTFRGTVDGKQSTMKGSLQFGTSRGNFEAKRH